MRVLACIYIAGLLVGTSAAFGAQEVKQPQLNRGFGDRGVVTIRTVRSGQASSALTVAKDGRGRLLVAGGARESFVAARLDPGGGRDRQFGKHGLVRVGALALPPDQRFAQTAQAQDISLGGRGKILMTGRLNLEPVGRSCLVMVRLLPSGVIDKSFGRSGRVTDCRTATDAFAAAFDQRGRIVVAGAINAGARQIGVLARYRSNGELDRSFGVSGRGFTKIYGPRRSNAGLLDLQAVGSRILASGHRDGKFLLARFRSDGSFDRSFGRRGSATADIDGCSCAIGWGLTRDRQRRIVVTGNAEPSVSSEYIATARFLPRGELDQSFGGDGVVTLGVSLESRSFHAATDSRGRVVVVGQADYGRRADRLIAARFSSAGRLDRSFARRGVFRFPLGNASGGRDLLLDRRQRIVVTGGFLYRGVRRLLIIRLRAD